MDPNNTCKQVVFSYYDVCNEVTSCTLCDGDNGQAIECSCKHCNQLWLHYSEYLSHQYTPVCCMWH